MLLTNFELRWVPSERTHFRVRITNLEADPLEYALDLFLASNDPGSDLTTTVRSRFYVPYYTETPGNETPWHRLGERYLKTVGFTVRPGATQSVVIETALTMPGEATQGWFEGYAALRLPGVRNSQMWSRFGPQIDHPARVLLATEALLEQEERGVIVHPLPLASGASEVEIEPDGNPYVTAVKIDEAHIALVERLTRGDTIRVAEGLDDVERLALLVDELQRLGADPDAFDAINALLHEQQGRIRLCRPD